MRGLRDLPPMPALSVDAARRRALASWPLIVAAGAIALVLVAVMVAIVLLKRHAAPLIFKPVPIVFTPKDQSRHAHVDRGVLIVWE